MEDGNKQPHTFGNGQQRTHHPRPFFYVQPPSQPYYVYQHWQLSNPYSHYGLPGGFNYNRPCMPPYQYMQYPGYVYPQAPMYPVDNRRMFEPRFHAPPWSQQPYSQPHGHREMACSEAQTDPSEAINKLIECLDKIRANELQGAERELDSGVASQSSGMFSPGEEKKSEGQGHVLPPGPDDTPAVAFSDSTTAVYDAESSHRSLDALSPQGCWSGAMEEELPLDSSSVHEDCPELEQLVEDQPFPPLESEEVTDIQSDVFVTDASVPRCEVEELLKSSLAPSFSSQPVLKEPKSSDTTSKSEHQAASREEAKSDASYQILKLPFESLLPPGAAGAGRLSSPAAPYFYNYLTMQSTHERMSVLSPSLDELSSRDEMFSTDLDDVELFPKHVYTGRRLAEVVGVSPQAAEEVEEVWLPGSKRFMCACCGRNLAKGAGRNKGHSSTVYRDEAGDSDEEGRYVRGCEQPVRVVVRKHSAPRKPQAVPPRQAAKPWYKRNQYKDASLPFDQEGGHGLCEQEAAGGELGAVTGSELQFRTCEERVCREDLTSAEKSRWADGEVIPRRRQGAAPPRQEMSSQRKVMYQRPRDEDNDDEPPPLHWERDMNAATSTLHRSFGLGPRGPMPPHGAAQAQGPHHPPPCSSGAPRAEEQHHKPFFYIQPSQPYMSMQSLQWPVPMPMPVSYNPYYGYPGLGYGMPMMPHYQPNPYMEPPGFVVPHTHLHLMDYRRLLSPQYYQTMAYHSRRFRYQQNGPAREMTSSQVQTEPLSAAQRSSTPASRDASAASACSSDSTSVSTSQMISPVKHLLEHEDPSPSSPTRTPPTGSFVIQTEEVRIECCTTPVGLQLLHARETAEVSHRFTQDVVQCSSILQGGLLQDDGLCLPADQSEQTLQACPDLLLVGGGEDISALEESRNPELISEVSDVASQVSAHEDVDETKREEDLSNFRFNIVHLPFDPKYLDELRKMESTVWSVEETLIPSHDSLIQNGCSDSDEETLAAVAEVLSEDDLTLNEEAPVEEVFTMNEMPPLAEDEVDDMVPAAESPADQVCPVLDVSEDAPLVKLMPTAEVAPSVNLLGNSPLSGEGNQRGRDPEVQDHQDTSFESLPAYLPSSNWFDNVYYCSKMPPAPQKPSKPAASCGVDVPVRRRKLDSEYKEQNNVRKPKERFKPKGKVDRRSLSDHECCLRRNFNENAFAPYASTRERLCSRCSGKQRICTAASPGLDSRSLKRKAVPLQQWNESPVPTCDACKFHTKKPMTKGSGPEVLGLHQGPDTEGESSENSLCRRGSKWRQAEDPRKLVDFKRPLASKQNQEKCPAAAYQKLREKNCVCLELQHQPVAWERLRHCHHGHNIQEMDENCAMPVPVQDKWRNVDQIYWTHRWQTEKSWKGLMPDVDGSKNEARWQHLNMHKKSQSQGTRRKDTRC